MAATINGKPILASGNYLFMASDVVHVPGSLPITIKVDVGAGSGINLVGQAGGFDLTVDGLTQQSFDQVATGGGSWNGQGFSWYARAARVAETVPSPLYQVSYTIYAV